MSLHIGNLSPHVRGEHLERVFRRFGRCSIRVKGKYGFVDYDYPASAEKALKTLGGTRVLGEAVTLSWSKNQPHAAPRFDRGRRFYDPSQGRHFARENVDRRVGSNEQRDYRAMDIEQEDGEIRNVGSSDLVGESISKTDDSKRHVGGENKLGDDRWEEQVVGRSNENYLKNRMDSDRYDPYNGDGKKELDGDDRISPVVGSPSVRRSRERARDRYNQESQRTNNSPKVLACGDSPAQHINPRGRSKDFRDRKRSRSESRDKNHLERKRGPSSSSVISEYASSRSRSPSRSLRSASRSPSPAKTKLVPSVISKSTCSRSQSPSRSLRSVSRNPSPTKTKSVLSVISEYTSSRSRSPSGSLRSMSRSPSPTKTKSVPSKKIYLPSSLRSSPSRRSMSRSTSPTSSLSPIEINRHLSPSPSKRQKGSKFSVANDFRLAHNTDLCAEETPVRSGGVLKSENTTSVVENKRETRLGEFDQKEMKDPPEKNIEHCDVVNEDVVEEHISAPEYNIHSMANGSNPARMSLEETCMVLKHYGLQYPDKNEKDLSVETYFGSARLWPWEIIYYRRLKRGPISTENYSRRTAQNEEFGIVDKYIRSSSGWGEPNENNP